MESLNVQKRYGIIITSVVYDLHAPKNQVTGRTLDRILDFRVSIGITGSLLSMVVTVFTSIYE